MPPCTIPDDDRRRVCLVVRRLLPFLLVLLLRPGLLPAAPRAAPSQPAVRIEADRMESDQKSRTVVFVGNVIARQGELRIQADEMQVFYGAKQGAERADAQAIERLTARGHVTIAKKDWTASGEALEYIAHRRYAVLTGNARAWQGGNVVSGQRIELYLDEGRTVVEKGARDSGRVKAFFYPGDQEGPAARGEAGGQRPPGARGGGDHE